MTRYKITINRDLCIGAGSCFAIASRTFKLNRENKANILLVNGDNLETIMLAAQSCPTKSITLIDNESGNQIYP